VLRQWSLAGLFLLPAVAGAQPIQGLYVGAGVGANFAGTLSSSHDLTKVYTDPGPLGLLALGWGFGNGLRAEIEGSYRSNGISGISTLRTNGKTVPLSNVSGSAQTYAVMANVAYDIPLHPFGWPLQPYIGAGAGYGWFNFNNAHGNGTTTFQLPDNNTFGPWPDLVSFGSAGAFAYQAFAGVSLPLQFLPGLDATLEYRFFGTARENVPVTRVTTTGDVVNGVVPSSQTHNGFQLLDNAVLVGLRYSFGAPPAPVVAPAAARAPAVAPARSYLVFFDWDKATLTDRARQIISEAASNTTKVQYTRIEVNGYTDTSGTPQYNQGLSVRRAQTVAEELVKDGVPETAISIQGFGETHLLVPTGPGVREPQNRRVEIVIR
jgi:outer membrane protein OmpA-like peptidoglycan-associated protein